MNALSQPVRVKLARALNLLGSPVDGEVVAAGRAAYRMLEQHGFHSFESIIAVTETPATPGGSARQPAFDVQAMLDDLGAASDELSDWEYRFVESLRVQVTHGRTLTRKQAAKLRQIAEDHL